MKQIEIISTYKDGFRRGGIKHPCGPAIYNFDDIGEEELNIITNCDGFIVTISDDELVNIQDISDDFIITTIGEALINLKDGDLKKDGTPKVAAIERLLKDVIPKNRIDGENVDAAWAKYQGKV